MMPQHLRLFVDQLHNEALRDRALAKARDYYDLGHNQRLVRVLVAEARLANWQAIRIRKVLYG